MWAFFCWIPTHVRVERNVASEKFILWIKRDIWILHLVEMKQNMQLNNKILARNLELR